MTLRTTARFHVGISSVDEPLFAADPTFGISSRGSVIALDPARGRSLWTHRFAQSRGTASAGFLSHDVNLVGDDGERIKTYRALDGKLLLRAATERAVLVYSSLWVQGQWPFVGVGSRADAGLEAFRVR
ncbi:MAG TPA: hypothetical protein PLB39_07405 [Thermoleophilia bacterium]|nr:hypothetical protein [Thermoleophilia bacterium]